MSISYKPTGYCTISPYLVVNGAKRTIEFLTNVFGASVLRQIAGSDGTIMHAEVKLDDSVLMLTDGGPGITPVPSHVHVYVQDVDKAYKRAMEAGASSIQEPIKRSDENKRGAVKDAGGTTWWIATRVE